MTSVKPSPWSAWRDAPSPDLSLRMFELRDGRILEIAGSKLVMEMDDDDDERGYVRVQYTIEKAFAGVGCAFVLRPGDPRRDLCGGWVVDVEVDGGAMLKAYCGPLGQWWQFVEGGKPVKGVG